MNKKIIIIAIIILTGIFVYMYWRKRKNAKEIGESTKENPGKGSANTTKSPEAPKTILTDSVYPWKEGTTGNNVAGIQSGLNAAFDAGLKVDGIFGAKTKTALQKFLEISTITSYENRIQIIDILKNIINKKQGGK